jgi:IS5 family transposase
MAINGDDPNGDYTHFRVFEGKSTPSTEKILSLSDADAGYIKKGSRQAVIGYKPQLVRSGNGFVVSLIVPRGNAADSGLLIPAIEDAISRAGVIPSEVSVDDGYSSANNRQSLKDLGIDIVSMNGATGKKVTPIDEWESLEYKNARNDRSAIESLMFTIKYRFGFGKLSRRGLEKVTAELLEKVLAYNLCRMAQLEHRRRKEAARLVA